MEMQDRKRGHDKKNCSNNHCEHSPAQNENKAKEATTPSPPLNDRAKCNTMLHNTSDSSKETEVQ